MERGQKNIVSKVKECEGNLVNLVNLSLINRLLYLKTRFTEGNKAYRLVTVFLVKWLVAIHCTPNPQEELVVVH